MSTTVLTILAIGAFLAGWVDAVVGGGGLILIPLLMITNPGFSAAQALSTNKLAAVFGTGTAAVTLSRKVPSSRKALKYAPLALVASAGGALVASNIDKAIMRPLIIILLVVVGVYITLRPGFGQTSKQKAFTPVLIFILLAAIFCISFYDGLFGPGTGLFFIVAFTTIMGSDFVTSASWAKILNTFTNLGALVVFALQGEVLWWLGLFLAVANMLGAFIGARTMLGRGTTFVRVVILIVVTVMAAKLGYDQYIWMVNGG